MRCQPVRHGRISIQGDDQRYIVHFDELLSSIPGFGSDAAVTAFAVCLGFFWTAY
jgi:hypothetical protein